MKYPRSKLHKLILDFLYPGLFPYSLALLILIFTFLYRILDLPNPSELTTIFSAYYNEYGVAFLFVASIIESIFVLSIYFPGSLVIVLSVLATKDDIGQLALVPIIVGTGFFASMIFNYFIGKYGYYRILLKLGGGALLNSMHQRFSKNASKTIFLTGIHPNFLAIVTVVAGITDYPIKKTLAKVSMAILFWVVLWTIAGYFLVSKVRYDEPNQIFYLVAIFVVWGLFNSLIPHIKKRL